MATPSIVQSNTADQTSTATPQITLTGVTAGRLMVLTFINYVNDRTIISITDNQSNSWTVLQESAYTNGSSNIAYAVAGSSGDLTVTLTWGDTTSTYLHLAEVQDQDTTYLDASNNNSNPNGTTHYCAPTGEIDTSDNVIIFAAGIAANTPGTITIPSGYTSITTSVDSGQGWMAYLRSDTALTDHRAQWSITTSRFSECVIASFKGAAGGAPAEQPAMFFGCAL